jgi:hypothetical protein
MAARTSPRDILAQLERRDGNRLKRDAELLDLADDVLVGVRLERGLRAGDDAFDTLTLARGDSGLEEGGIDAEPAREPLDGLASRARLPALDLADVLLREAFAGELGLGQPARDPELADALAHRASGGGGGAGGGELIVHLG